MEKIKLLETKKYNKIKNETPIYDGELGLLNKDKFYIINEFSITIYQKVKLNIQIYAFFELSEYQHFLKFDINFKFSLFHHLSLENKKEIEKYRQNGIYPFSENDLEKEYFNFINGKKQYAFDKKEIEDQVKYFKEELLTGYKKYRHR